MATCPLGIRTAIMKRRSSVPPTGEIETEPEIVALDLTKKNKKELPPPVPARESPPVKRQRRKLNTSLPLPEWAFGVTTRSRSGRHILDLPPEILTNIFHLLDVEQLRGSCRIVCKRFNDLIVGKSFSEEKLREDFGPEGYAKLLTTEVSPIVARRFLNVNFYQGMYRWGHFDKPYVFRVKRDHRCSDASKHHFHALTTSPTSVMPWMDNPFCYCAFGRSIHVSTVREHSEVYGWCMVDFITCGVPVDLLDVVRPPIAVGMWDPHPESRFGFSAGMKTRLVNADGETLARGECVYEIGANGRQSVFQQYIFTDYPVGVRRIIFYGPNSFLVQITQEPNFCGATVKLLTHSAYADTLRCMTTAKTKKAPNKTK